MPTYTYDTGEQPIIWLRNNSGDVKIIGAERAQVELIGDLPREQASQQENKLEFDNAQDVELRVPRGTQVEIDKCDGDVAISDVASVRLINIAGDALLRRIAAEVGISHIDGDLNIENAGSIQGRGAVGGDVRVVQVSNVVFESIEGDAKIQNIEGVRVDHIGGDLSVRDAHEDCQLGQIEGDAALHTAGSITIGHVNGDLSVRGATHLNSGAVEGDCSIEGDELPITLGAIHGDLVVRIRTGTVQAGDIHGDLALHLESGALRMGNVHGDAALDGAFSQITLGTIAGDLALCLQPTTDGIYRINTHGDAAITLPTDSNITLNAVVRGSIAGIDRLVQLGQHGGTINVAFGEAGAQMHLTVGGDLVLRGPGTTTSSTWGPDMGSLNDELGRLGRELGNMGREIASSFGPSAWGGSRGRRHGRRANVKVDREQKEEIKRQVRSAVEQARTHVQQVLREARITQPSPRVPSSPAPPARPAAPAAPTSPPPDTAEAPQPVTGMTVPLTPVQSEMKPDTDAERLAILRMLQEGKITPEDADELLAALDQ